MRCCNHLRARCSHDVDTWIDHHDVVCSSDDLASSLLVRPLALRGCALRPLTSAVCAQGLAGLLQPTSSLAGKISCTAGPVHRGQATQCCQTHKPHSQPDLVSHPSLSMAHPQRGVHRFSTRGLRGRTTAGLQAPCRRYSLLLPGCGQSPVGVPGAQVRRWLVRAHFQGAPLGRGVQAERPEREEGAPGEW